MAGSERRLAPVAVLAVLVVVMAVVAGLTFWKARSGDLRTDDRQALEAAARQEMVLLNAVGDAKGSAWEKQVSAGVTDPLKSQLAPFLNQTDSLSAAGVTASPSVVEAGVRDQTADRAVVDLFVTVQVQQPKKDTVTAPYRWSATMKKVGGTWLMSGVEAVSSDAAGGAG